MHHLNTLNLKIVVLLLLSYCGYANACSCLKYNGSLEYEIEDRYADAAAVVLAKVEEIKDITIKKGSTDKQFEVSGQITLFSTINSWKGDILQNFRTKIETECCACGMIFQKDDIYLLFLHKGIEKNYYSTFICSGNRKLISAKKAIEILNNITSNPSSQRQ